MTHCKTVSIHSFRGGTGKSNTTANLAALLAAEGYRVGVIDTDIQSPGIHVLFGLSDDQIDLSLNDYLRGRCDIAAAAYDVTAQLGQSVQGEVFLVPSSSKAEEIARVLREKYDVGLLNDGIRDLIEALNLEVMLIDTHPGLNHETLMSIAISDVLIVVMRPDQQDYQGTGVTLEVARKLAVPRTLLLVNKLPPAFDLSEVKARVERIYQTEVAAVLPHSAEMMALASSGLFCLKYPNHAVTLTLKQIAVQLLERVR